MRKKGAEWKALLIFLVILMILADGTVRICAQTGDLNMDYVQVIYNEQNGAYSSNINDVVQAGDGTIYIGNSTGLVSYNGRKFTRIGNEIISEVNTIMNDSYDSLWAGTNDAGLVVVSGEDCTVFDRNAGFDSNCIREIITDKRAGVYVATTGSLYRFDRNMNFEKVWDDACTFTVSMACSDDGIVAGVTNSGGIYFIEGGEIQSGYESQILTNRSVCTGVNAIDNYFIFTTYDGDIITVTYDSGNITCERQNYEALNGINSIYDDGSRIWILADNGIGYVENDRFTAVSLEGFSGYYQKMFCDYEGNYWIASSKYGLMMLAKNDFRHISEKASVSKGVVNATLVHDGCIYAGMDNGLVILEQDTYESVENDLTRLLKDVKISSMVSDDDGNIWIATYGGSYGLIRYDGREISSYNHENGMPEDSVSLVKKLDENTIAAFTRNDIVFFEKGEIRTVIGEENGFANSEILDAVALTADTIVLGSDGDGIFVINKNEVVNQITSSDGLTSDVIRRIVPYGDGYLLVTGNSICYMKDFVISRLGFSYSGIYDIIIGRDDDLWILSSSGIFLIRGDELLNSKNPEYELFDYARGFQSTLTSNSKSGMDEEGSLYLCCQDGIVMMQLAASEISDIDYHIDIKYVRADEQLIDFYSFAEIPKDTVKLVIEPEFSKFGYEKLMVSYYLEGYDDDVTVMDASELPEKITYSNLSGGDYVFHIELLGSDGQTVISSKQLTVYKEIAWYEQGVIRTLITVLIILVILLFGHIFIRIQLTNAEKKKNTYRNITKQTIMAIAKTIDAKDEYTNGHSMRVAEYSMEIAKRMGMKPEQQEDMYYCGLLHDIGKIGIPDEILNKTSGLTDEEYEIIKTHPAKGAEILRDVTTIPHIVEGARYHHERYDGSGYNEGLKGNDIPLFARIIAVADTFDAMTSSRCYRVGLDREYVVNELKRVSGSQLDPTFVNIMLGMIEDGFVPDERFTSDSIS